MFRDASTVAGEEEGIYRVNERRKLMRGENEFESIRRSGSISKNSRDVVYQLKQYVIRNFEGSRNCT